jgi:peptide deformylase
MKLEIENMPNGVRTFKTLTWDKITAKSSPVTESYSLGKPRKKGWPVDVTNIAWRMVKTCLAEEGIGLAAPQIGVFKRIMICRDFVGDGWFYGFAPAYQLYLNPEFEAETKEGKCSEIEYCLSVPGKGFSIVRWKVIKASWDEYGKAGNLIRKTKKLQGFPARLFQHEYDHLNGISIPQRFELQNKKSTKKPKKRKKK